MRQKLTFLGIFLLFLSISTGVSAQNTATIADMLLISSSIGSDDFTTLRQLLQEADLLEMLDDTHASYTLFAPTNEAFEDYFDEMGLELDDLLADPDSYRDMLLYHIVNDTPLNVSGWQGQVSELHTLSGSLISVSRNRMGSTLINQFAVTSPDYEASNGVIYVMSGVLRPNETVNVVSQCLIFTEDANSIQVRVGPGENRSVIAFLPADTNFEVLGQANDNEGDVWYKLDKEEATPNRSNAEAWIAADDIEIEGDCSQVASVGAPAIIPIVSEEPATEENTGDTTEATTSTTTEDGQIVLETGLWTETLSETVDATCHGVGNVSIPINDLYDQTVYSYNLSLNGTGFSLDGVEFEYLGHNTYQSTDDSYGTWYVQVTGSNQMESYYVVSFHYANCTCTATIFSRISH